VRNGIFGLLAGLILFTSVSIGLSLEPGLMSELFIDILISSATCLAVLIFIFGGRVSLFLGFISLVFVGISWGGHAATRETDDNLRACIGSDRVLIRFQAVLVSRFQQPEALGGDLLDEFQNAVKPPPFRALAQMIHVSNIAGIYPCSGNVTLFIDDDGAEFLIGDVVEGVGWIRGVEPPRNPGESDFRVRAFRNNQGGNISVAGNLKKNFWINKSKQYICAVASSDLWLD